MREINVGYILEVELGCDNIIPACADYFQFKTINKWVNPARVE